MSDTPAESISIELMNSQPRNSRFKQSIRMLQRYLRPQGWRVALLAGLLLAGIGLQLANPQIIRYFLDTAQAGAEQRPLLLAAGAYIAFSLLQSTLSVITLYLSGLVGWTATNRLRSDLALHLLRLDLPFHKQHSPGELIERVDGDVNALSHFMSQFVIHIAGNLLLVVGILLLLFREDLLMGVFLSLYTALTLIVLSWVEMKTVRPWTEMRQSWAELFGFMEERIGGAEEIRAAGAEGHALNQLFVRMRALTIKARKAILVGVLSQNITNLLFAGGYAIGLTLGVSLYARGQASIGTAYLIVSYFGMLSNPLQNLRAQVEDLKKATSSIQRTEELFAIQPQVRETSAPVVQPKPGALGVAFKDVDFHYDDNENVLCGVNFELRAGKVLGVLGRTGSGKTTLTRLLFRLYDPAGGMVTLDDINISRLPINELRGRVGMVTQDVQLFQATLRDNLTFFNASISDAELERGLRALRLWDWVLSLPAGLDTWLASGGQGLSAGEAQLLAFTRVFLKNPGLVVLDEASSRLDPATEARLEQAIDCLFENRTGIVIAHRLHTVQRADDILILEKGEVVEYGPRLALAADPASRFSSLLKTGLEEALV